MSLRCKDLQRRLTLQGARSLADDDVAQQHLASCEECFAVLEGLDALDRALARLPATEPPEVVLDQLAARVALEPFDDEVGEGPLGNRGGKLAGRLLAVLGERSVRWRLAAVLVAGLGTAILLPILRNAPAPEPHFTSTSPVDAETRRKSALAKQENRADLTVPGSGERPPESNEVTTRVDDFRGELDQDALGDRRESEKKQLDDPEAQRRSLDRVAAPKPLPDPAVGGERAATLGGKLELRDATTATEEEKERRSETGGPMTFQDEVEVVAEILEVHESRTSSSTIAFIESVDIGEEDGSVGAFSKPSLGFAGQPVDVESAEQFLADRQRIEGLTFRDATGYWRNTYVPGDRTLRLLSSRLLAAPPTDTSGSQQEALARLHDGVRRPAQPFDPPQDAALALALSSDRRSVAGESRVLLQVGLQATDRRAGRRPPLDLALVLDLSGELSQPTATSFRALVLALSSARQPDDRFRLIVAGRPGGVLVEADDFRFGPLQVALDDLFGIGGSTRATLDLPGALRSATEVLRSEQRPGSPLGSSAILLATGRTLGDSEMATVESLAHAAAVDSVPLSALGVGEAVDHTQLDRLAIAGQGSRRLLTVASGAAQLVDRELAAASRAVARAVRLSIRLAPGVRLVDVMGSQSLDGRAAQRVRDAEQSVDQKIARSLGIAADRGEDEDGIQIVIPAFFAGDSHVVLVDLVVPGPGAVADVSVRFKDLVQSRNGVAADRLELPRGTAERGPLELNVLHNLLVLRLVDALDQAGQAAAAGRTDEARHLLETHLRLLRGLEELLPGFAGNREAAADATLLEGYLAFLTTGEASAETLAQLSDSLRYAARLKVLPAPERVEP